ncbi:MAG: HAMP domain-containing protein [Kiritimatiellae bacterium]|nr:HAMP domain-containing protein [Kiritimatiellia bacterium]
MRIGLHHKITLAFGAVVACVLCGAYLYLNRSLREHTYRRIRADLHKDTALAATLLTGHLAYGAAESAFDAFADQIGQALEVRVTIVGLDGTVRGDSELDAAGLRQVENHLHRPEIQAALANGGGEGRRFSDTIQRNLLYVAHPFGGDEPRGVVRLAMPLSEIEQISSRLKALLGASLLAAFVATLLLGHAVAVRISRPMKRLAAIANRVAEGDFTQRAVAPADDEVGDLASAVNHMSEEIQRQIAEVSSGRSHLEAVLLSMFEGVMVLDAGGSVVLMNRALRRALFVEGDTSGKQPMEVIRNREIGAIADRVLAMREGVASEEIGILLPVERTLLVHAAPVLRDGTVEGAVLVFHDVTELRRLERVRRDFVANVAHELRTPVTNIRGYAETLLDGALADAANAKEFVATIAASSRRLAALIDDLLRLAGLESGEARMQLEPSSVQTLVARLFQVLRPAAGEKGLVLRSEIPAELPAIRADEDRMSQVLLNLLDNAVKYTPAGGTVTVSAESDAQFVRIRVADTGIGIPAKDLDRIFERFYRVDKARSRELGGTGLGLSIVKHIVQAHEGQVAVESTLGKGSTFSVSIPRA